MHMDIADLLRYPAFFLACAAGGSGDQPGSWTDGSEVGHTVYAAHRPLDAASGHRHAVWLAGGQARGAGVGVEEGVQPCWLC